MENYYIKIFCLIWVVYKLQYELRDMRYEFSFKWFKNNVLRVLDCWYCVTFWLSLAITFDIFAASVLAFVAHIIEIIINRIQTFKI